MAGMVNDSTSDLGAAPMAVQLNPVAGLHTAWYAIVYCPAASGCVQKSAVGTAADRHGVA